MKQYTPEEKKKYFEKRDKELKNKIKQFAVELGELTDKTKFNKKFIEFIEFQKKFWNYSIYNQILISLSCPNASYVMGLRQWSKKFKRTVKTGSQAIYILAPMFYKSKSKEKTIITNANSGKTETINIDTLGNEYLTGFRSVPVFDVSQTTGEELPKLEHRTGTNLHGELLNKMEKLLGNENIPLVYTKLRNGLNGYTDGKTITVNEKLSKDDRLQTMLHEYGHTLKHFQQNERLGKKQVETEAEAFSYICCRILGVKTKGYNYIALYQGDSNLIIKTLGRINRAIKETILKLEEIKITAITDKKGVIQQLPLITV